ncbi:hypothetical protein ACFOLD_06155 [Kocuria carniphila]
MHPRRIDTSITGRARRIEFRRLKVRVVAVAVIEPGSAGRIGLRGGS